MHPFFLNSDLGGIPLDVPSYFTMVMIAFLVGTSLVVREARREGVKVVDVLDLSLVCLVAGLVGARLGHVFFESPWIDDIVVQKQDATGWQHILCRWTGDAVKHQVSQPWNLGRYYLLHPQMVLAVWNGGVVFYGGLLLGLPCAWWFCKRRGLHYWRTADLVAPILAAGLSFGRIGCLLAGCCYGLPAKGAFASLGISIDGDSPVPIWPTQLFECLAAMAIAYGLFRMRRVRRFDGQVFIALLVLYGIWRPINESLRGDGQRIFHFGLSTSQWISAGILVAAFALIPPLWKRRVVPGGKPAGPTLAAGAAAT